MYNRYTIKPMICLQMGWPMEQLEDFVRRAQRHDEEAFRHLVLTYTAVVAKTTQALLNDRSVAEDAAQEAWLDVWRGLPSLRTGAAFRPWLLAIVANRCRMLARRSRLVTASLEASTWLLPGPDDVVWTAMQRETGTEILAAFKTLSTHHQRILALHYFAELDIGEIGVVLGIPSGTVKSRLHRALTLMRTALQEPAPMQLEQHP
jgi:RNA polymerase sigma factor (sigma-70 family)